MIDYYCTDLAVEYLRTLDPQRIEDFYNYDDEIDENYVLFRIGIDTYCIAKTEEFTLPVGNIESIEYLENGLPKWTGILPGRTYCQADWTGSSWEFTRAF